MKLAQPQIPLKKRIVPARAWRKGGLGRPEAERSSLRGKNYARPTNFRQSSIVEFIYQPENTQQKLRNIYLLNCHGR
jgi:hypothetical protein